MKVLLGITGSVAAKVTPKMVKAFKDSSHEVSIILTESAKHFVNTEEFGLLQTWDDKNEFPLRSDWVNDDGTMFIPHIHLKDWADVLVIAPLTANTLGKISHGLADNLLTCTFRAWVKGKPIVLAPAMNTDMWKHPATLRNISVLDSMYLNMRSVRSCTQKVLHWIYPVEKKLACGQQGIGALAPISDIVDLVNKL